LLSTKSLFLGDLNEKLGREHTFKPTVRNESLNENSSLNVITVVKLATSKYLIVEMKMCPLPDGKTQNQMECFWMDSRSHSNR